MRFLGGVKMLFVGQSVAKFSTNFCRSLVIKKTKLISVYHSGALTFEPSSPPSTTQQKIST